MKLKSLFSRKPVASTADPALRQTEEARLDLDALDACVGGRVDEQGVGCYGRADQARTQ